MLFRSVKLAKGIEMKLDPKSKHVEIIVLGNPVRSYKVKKTDLWAIAFAIADEKTQEQMMPVRKTIMTQFIREYRIKATKDVKQGEFLTFRVNIDMPKVVEEELTGAIPGRELSPEGSIVGKVSKD